MPISSTPILSDICWGFACTIDPIRHISPLGISVCSNTCHFWSLLFIQTDEVSLQKETLFLNRCN